MKNLVFLHLESVSKLILQMNEEQFPNLVKFKKRCVRYQNYYSTATSTAMVLNDIVYSDFYRIENTHLFGEFIETHKDAKSFVDELTEAGFCSLGVHYPSALGDEINPGHMYARNSELVNYSDYKSALNGVIKTIDNAVQKEKPFLIYFCNEVSHLCYEDSRKFHIKNPTARWHYGYRTIDQTVGDVIGYLEERNLMSDTVIVLYGDHGDDFYCHDYNGGYAHSIEPYANIIHTPFMIYDESIGSRDVTDIICSLDIKQLVYNLIGFNNTEKNPYIYDVFRSKREHVFSRNLFAGQTPEKINGYISNVRKSYAVTNSQYSMILTNEGIRLYLNCMDPTCNNNVLDYFYLVENKVKHICKLNFLNVHYKSYMGYGTVGELQRCFKKMRKVLCEELNVLQKETGLSEIIKPEAVNKIFYTKNMRFMFLKLKIKFYKKKIINLKKHLLDWRK